MPPPPASGFNLSTLMLVIAALAVILGLMDQAPLLGLILLIFAGIALARTATIHRARQQAGQPLTHPEQTRIFLRTVGALMLMGLAGMIAFTVVCFPIGLVGMTGAHDGTGLVIGCIAGLMAGCAAIWFTYTLLNRRRDPEKRP